MSLSKLFIEKVTKKNLRCSDLYHPGESCLKFNFYLLKNTWIHCAKFYAPIALLPLVKKLNSVQWTEAKKSLSFYINLIVGTIIPSALTVSLVCVLSNYFGRIYLSTLIYIPNLIMTTLYVPWMDQRVANTFGNILLVVHLEALIREGRTSFLRLLRDSKWIQTILFMGASSIVVDTMSSMPTNIFWFINPRPKEVCTENDFVERLVTDKVLPTKSSNCDHNSSCNQHIWRSTKQISMTMIGFETLRVILTNIKTISVNPFGTGKLLKSKINFPLMVMVSGYTTVYHISKCIQNRLSRAKSMPTSRYTNLMSGFLCGSVFWLNADLSLLCHGLSAAIQLTFQNYFMDWLATKNKSIANSAANFPWSKVFFLVTIGYALHLSILYPSLCSKFMHKIADAVVSCRFREVRKHTFRAIFSNVTK
ncbi:uncharacterized protein LOC119068581 [Bradysia coprophila]|uniref:uncharacterized protein LOC119068581 n=1 Tax=Bradysia coprophila TaxID=38358 RepID=UPI00187DC107|nr:uncharacterized protein LOC119068581 [Bradysia coprophila]